jgi:hypothetical protein
VIQYGRKLFAYRFQTDGGDREVACFLEPSWVMEHGLNVEAVFGFIVPAASIDRLSAANLRENSALPAPPVSRDIRRGRQRPRSMSGGDFQGKESRLPLG